MRVISEDLLSELKKRGQTIGFAESCTGGKISGEFVNIPGVSEVYKGSVVSYADEVKAQLLGVQPQTLKAFGAVSEEVAREMAQGARVALNVDWGISVTGIAGPSGGTEEKPVGTVWFGVIGPGFEKVEACKFDGDRDEIRKQSVEKALQLALNAAREF